MPGRGKGVKGVKGIGKGGGSSATAVSCVKTFKAFPGPLFVVSLGELGSFVCQSLCMKKSALFSKSSLVALYVTQSCTPSMPIGRQSPQWTLYTLSSVKVVLYTDLSVERPQLRLATWQGKGWKAASTV